MLRFLIFSPSLLFIQPHTRSSIQCNLCSTCSCFHILINTFPFHFFTGSSSSFLSFSEALTGVMCRGNALFFSFQAWVSYWGATLDLHLISLQPRSCGQARHSLSLCRTGDAVTFRSKAASLLEVWGDEARGKVFLMTPRAKTRQGNVRLNSSSLFRRYNSGGC